MPRAKGTANEAAALKRQQLSNISNHLTSQQNAHKHSTSDGTRRNNGAPAQPNRRQRREEKLRHRNQRGSDAAEEEREQGSHKQPNGSKTRLEDHMTRNDEVRPPQEREVPHDGSVDEQNQEKAKHPKRKKKSHSPTKHDKHDMKCEETSDVHGSDVAQETVPALRKEQPTREPIERAKDKVDDREGTPSSEAKPISKDTKLSKDVGSSSSPESSNKNSIKGSIEEVDAEPSEQTPKKQRQSPDEHTNPKQAENGRKTKKVPKKVHPNPYKAPNIFAPVVAIPESRHAYKHYNDNSIPILHSVKFERHDPTALPNDPSPELRVKAHMLVEKPGGFNADDLGRTKVTKTGPTKVISDVDLYLHEDGKVYVGTEHGLILAAKYIKLADIPDTTAVRFNGIKPGWVKASIERRFVLKVKTTTFDPDAPHWDNPFPPLPEGDLGLMKGAPVQVWERNLETRRAFGRRLDDNLVGWFDWKNLEPIDAPYGPWDEEIITEELFEATANDPVLTKLPAIMPPLINVPLTRGTTRAPKPVRKTLPPTAGAASKSSRPNTPNTSRFPSKTPPLTAAPTSKASRPTTPSQVPVKTALKVADEKRPVAGSKTPEDLEKRPAKAAKTEPTSEIKANNVPPIEANQGQKRKSTSPEEDAQNKEASKDSDERPTKAAKTKADSVTKSDSVSPVKDEKEKKPDSAVPKDSVQAKQPPVDANERPKKNSKSRTNSANTGNPSTPTVAGAAKQERAPNSLSLEPKLEVAPTSSSPSTAPGNTPPTTKSNDENIETTARSSPTTNPSIPTDPTKPNPSNDEKTEPHSSKPTTPDADDSPSNESNSSGTSHHEEAGMRALYDKSIEDEVDWDDGEL